MRLRLAVIAILVILGATVVVWADMSPWGGNKPPMSGPTPPITLPPGVPLVVSIDERATEAHLIVPKQHVRSIAALTGEGDTLHADAGRMRWPTIGIPLAAALAVTGFCLTGLRPRISKRPFVILIGMIVLGGVAAFAWGRAQLPILPPPPPLKGKVTVEIVEDGDTVKLVLNREMLKDLLPDK